MPAIQSIIDTNIAAFEDLVGISFETYWRMSDSERDNFWANTIGDLSAEEQTEIRNQVDEISYNLSLEFSVNQAEFQNIIDSAHSTVEERARAEFFLNEVNRIIEAMDLAVDDYDNGVDIHNSTNISTNGMTHSNDVNDMIDQNGREVFIDTSSNDPSDNPANSSLDFSEGMVDSDGDGLVDTLRDADGDGIADQDWSGDGVISEIDMDPSLIPQPQPEERFSGYDDVQIVSYDPETGDVTLGFMTANGIGYYHISGQPPVNIRLEDGLGSLTEEQLLNLPPELLDRIYTNTNHSLAYHLGVETTDSAPDGTDYYTIIDMSDKDNEHTLEPSDIDFEQGREYTVEMDPNEADVLNLEFDDDIVLNFEEDPDNHNIIIYATNPQGETITIIIENWEGSPGDDQDQINISGGVVTSGEAADTFFTDNGGSATETSENTASHIIYHNGTPLRDEFWVGS